MCSDKISKILLGCLIGTFGFLMEARSLETAEACLVLATDTLSAEGADFVRHLKNQNWLDLGKTGEDLYYFFIVSENGEVRAVHSTEVAAAALLAGYYVRRVISLCVVSR